MGTKSVFRSWIALLCLVFFVVSGPSALAADSQSEDYSSYAGIWVCGDYYGDAEYRGHDSYEEGILLRFTGSNSLIFSWNRYRITGLDNVKATLDPATGIAVFSHSNASNSASGTLVFRDQTVTITFDRSDLPYTEDGNSTVFSTHLEEVPASSGPNVRRIPTPIHIPPGLWTSIPSGTAS